MIRAGNITYPDVNKSLDTWQPRNHALNTFLIATLATILAYQLAAILFDLLLGLKPPGQTTASNISILLLSEDYSLFTLLANLHISPTLSRWKFHGFRSPDHHDCHHSHKPFHPQQQQQQALHIREDDHGGRSFNAACLCSRPSSRPSTATVLKLAVLLAAAPMANLLAVFLTVESDRKLTFRQVNFGGMAFGLNQNFSKANAELRGEVCTEYGTSLSDLETSAATFYYCAPASQTRGQVPSRGAAVLRMSYGMPADGRPTPKEAVLVEFEQAPELVSIAVHADLRDRDGRVWRVKTKVDDIALLRRLFRAGVDEFKGACDSSSEKLDKSVYSEKISESGDAWSFEWQVKCAYHIDLARLLMENTLLKFTLIESDTMEVLALDDDELQERDGEIQLRDAGGFEFVERRRSFMTVGVLGICVIVVVVVRIIVRAVTRNDVHLGIELVMKDTLRLQRCDSMLQNENRIDYSDRVYEGAVDVRTVGGGGGGGVGGGFGIGGGAQQVTTVALTHSSDSDNLNLHADNLI